MPELTFLGREICRFVFVFLKILGFSTTKNSSPEIFEGMFGEEIWEIFLVICGIFFNYRGKDGVLGFSTTKTSSQEVIKEIFGEEIWEEFLIICGICFY